MILFGFGFLYILSDTEKMVLLLLFLKSQNQLLVILRVKSSSVILNVESYVFSGQIQFKNFMQNFQGMGQKWVYEGIITTSITDFYS